MLILLIILQFCFFGFSNNVKHFVLFKKNLNDIFASFFASCIIYSI